ncbi:hypothetical protein TSOC_013928, partial [Tetrabaena socialis]
GAHRPPRRWHL